MATVRVGNSAVIVHYGLFELISATSACNFSIFYVWSNITAKYLGKYFAHFQNV